MWNEMLRIMRCRMAGVLILALFFNMVFARLLYADTVSEPSAEPAPEIMEEGYVETLPGFSDAGEPAGSPGLSPGGKAVPNEDSGETEGEERLGETAPGFDASESITVTSQIGEIKADRRSGLDPALLSKKTSENRTYTAELVKGQKYSLGKGVWSSTAPNTVAVSKKTGAVTAKKSGTARLTNSDGEPVYYNMTVYEPALSTRSRSVFAGSTEVVSINNTGSLPVSWVSDDVRIASVERDDTNGTIACITGIAKGKTKVYACVNGRRYPVTVNVRDNAVSGTLAADDLIRLNALQSYTLKYNSSVFKPKGASWDDESGSGTAWTNDGKGNYTHHLKDITITNTGRVIARNVTEKPVTAIGTDKNGKKVKLQITIDAIPTKTDIYMNKKRTASLKHTNVKDPKKVTWTEDGSIFTVQNVKKPTAKIRSISMGDAELKCSYQDILYSTFVHVEDPEVVTDSRMSRPKASSYSYNLTLKKWETYDIAMKGVYQDVLWKSDKVSKVFVDEYGRISARDTGKATLTTTVNGRKLKINVMVTESEYKPIAFDESWTFAANSKIKSGIARLYATKASRPKGITVCINAGHGTKGGTDYKTLCHPDGSPKIVTGSTSAGATEATAISMGTTMSDGEPEAVATLKAALAVKEALLREGYDVLMIREEDDVQLDNIARTLMANNAADAHIALHYDSTAKDKGVFYCSVPDVESYKNMEPVRSHWEDHEKLGKCLVDGLEKAGLKKWNTGALDMDLTQTSYSTVPSIDLEIGDTVSDYSDEALAKVAAGVTSGLNEFYGK